MFTLSHPTTRPSNANRIFASLPPEEYERLAPHLEEVELTSGHLIYDAGGQMDHAYFPHTAMISLVSQMSDGGSHEVGVVGFEGVSGISAILGVDRSPHEAMAQIPGGATRVKMDVLKREFERGGALQASLLRFTQAMILQISQVAACNSAHSIEERLARWLLMAHDRCKCEDLPLTQEFISMMLGCRRSGVTIAVGKLQAQGFIKSRRGNVRMLDREGLEDFACECYSIVKEEFDRLLADEDASGRRHERRI
jgi:CRP-like cAMP-binding protein